MSIKQKDMFEPLFVKYLKGWILHYNDIMMKMMAPQITSPTIVYSTVYSGPNQRKHQSSASLTFVRGIHQWPVNFPTQRSSNAENVSIWWHHHGLPIRSQDWKFLSMNMVHSLCCCNWHWVITRHEFFYGIMVLIGLLTIISKVYFMVLLSVI